MPLRGGPPPELGLGGVGQQAAPQVPGLLQMAQSAMDGAGARGGSGGSSGGGFGGGGPGDQFGWLQGSIAAPPEGWQSQKGIYDQAGFGNGWLMNNSSENPDAYAATMAGRQMPYGIDPFTDITYAPDTSNVGSQTSGFHLVDRRNTGSPGQDLFGGRLFQAGNLPRDIPQQLQPWLAPALMKYFIGQQYHNQGGTGVNAPWTGRYAPKGADIKTWPGITNYDPWGRSQGDIPNYSGG